MIAWPLPGSLACNSLYSVLHCTVLYCTLRGCTLLYPIRGILRCTLLYAPPYSTLHHCIGCIILAGLSRPELTLQPDQTPNDTPQNLRPASCPYWRHSPAHYGQPVHVPAACASSARRVEKTMAPRPTKFQVRCMGPCIAMTTIAAMVAVVAVVAAAVAAALSDADAEQSTPARIEWKQEQFRLGLSHSNTSPLPNRFSGWLSERCTQDHGHPTPIHCGSQTEGRALASRLGRHSARNRSPGLGENATSKVEVWTSLCAA